MKEKKKSVPSRARSAPAPTEESTAQEITALSSPQSPKPKPTKEKKKNYPSPKFIQHKSSAQTTLPSPFLSPSHETNRANESSVSSTSRSPLTRLLPSLSSRLAQRSPPAAAERVLVQPSRSACSAVSLWSCSVKTLQQLLIEWRWRFSSSGLHSRFDRFGRCRLQKGKSRSDFI